MTIGDLTFSVIVNTTDRAGPLQTLLHALEYQSYPHFEVIVVVGPTRDHTLDMLSRYADRVRVLRCPAANLSRSRNIGLLAARGEIVAFVDDDAVPSRNWLWQLARLFADPALDATGGRVYLAHPDLPMIQHSLGIISSLAEQVDARASWLAHIAPPGAGRQWVARMMGTNMAYRRKALLDIGGFDEFFEWLFDDSDVALRLTNAGKIVHPVREAVVYHIPASSRNRVALSFNVKWWLQTKSVVYFTVKNGRAAGDSPHNILLRGLHFAHGHWLWAMQLWRERRLTLAQAWRMRLMEVWSAVNGAQAAWATPRRLVPSASAKAVMNAREPIQIFQNADSARQPTVDPVAGRRASISMPDSPLRICLLSSAYPPVQIEGVGRHTNLMARGLFECGHAVHVITRGERDVVSFYDGAYVHQIAPRVNRYDQFRVYPFLHATLNHSHAAYDRIRQLILNDGIQVVDSPLWQLDGLVTSVGGVLPVVVRLQTALRQIADIQNNRNDDARLIGEMERAFVERATHLVPNSQATLEAVQRVYGLQPAERRFTIVPHGIMPVPDSETQPFGRDRPAHDLTVLYVGRLEKRKGILDLFAAIPRVMGRLPNVRFIIAGADNSQHDGFQNKAGLDYPAYFASRYPRLLDRVQFTGAVGDDQLNRLYQSCDLFVAPSLYESFGLIYLEAMNYAKAVIGCHAGGIPEVVDHGVTGLLIEPEAPAALAEAILSLLKSPDRLRDMGLAGRQRLLERYTYLQMARAFADIYRSVVTASSAASTA
jgi:glycosyltransferase involved in cell wall biosynthesis